MTISKTMKRTSKRRRRRRIEAHNNGSSSIAHIKALPRDLLVDVIARVASNSFTDLFNLKKCCKEFLDAAEDSYVNQHVCLDKFPLIQWFPNEEISMFLNQCKESKNMEALYREGLREYFNYPNGNICGLDMMKVAAQHGHMEAKYVFGMIALCSDDIELRKEGLQHLRFVRASKCVIRCRKRVKNLTSTMWKNNMMLLQNKKSLCNNNNMCKGWRAKKGLWTLIDDEDDDYDDINMCEYCRWDHELMFFYRLFNVK